MIVARGRILETKTISTALADDGDTKYAYRFSFVPNFDYAPRPKVIVYFIRNRTIVSTTTSVELYEDFKNFIDLDITPNEAKPGQMVDINVKSNPNAYVGLLGIDKSVLILRSGNDLSRDDIWNELDSIHTHIKSRINSQSLFQAPTGYYNEWMDFHVN